MLSLDLFDSKYERELREGAVDNLEARRIDDLNMRMLELLDRAKEPAYRKNPGALEGLKRQFQKIKAERDSYFKINPATGMDPTGSLGTVKGKLDETEPLQKSPARGHDVIDRAAKMRAATPAKPGVAGAVKDVVGGVKRWLKGEPDQGPTYEGQEGSSPRALGAANFQRLVKANMGNIPTVSLEFIRPEENFKLDQRGLDLISDYYDGLENDQAKNYFIYRVLPSGDETLTVLKQLGWTPARPVQQELPGMPTQGELPLQEKKKSNSDDLEAGDVKVARELQKLRAQYPAARSDVEAVARAEIDSTERSQQQLSAIRGANEKQDALLKQLVALDQEQGREISGLDKENNSLEQRLAQVQSTNARLQQAVGKMASAKKAAKPQTTAPQGSADIAQGGIVDVGAPVTPAPIKQATAPDEEPPQTKSSVIGSMARQIQGLNKSAPGIRPAPDIGKDAANDGKKKAAESKMREHGGGIGPRQHWQDLMQETVADVKQLWAQAYHKLAPKIERHRDSFLAGQLYDELENIAELHGAEGEFKRMMSTARGRAHMEYDTNPGGFHNWFWFLPFEDNDVEEGWKSTVGGAALAGAMALGAGGAQARVAGDNVDNPDVNRLTGKPNVTQAVQGDQVKPSAPTGFSKEYLQSVVDGTHPRPMVSKEKAQALLNQLKEQGVAEGFEYASKVQHPKYGAGQVIKVHPNGMITVNFPNYPDPIDKKPGVRPNFAPGDSDYQSLKSGVTEGTDDIKKRMSKLEALALAANRAGDDAKCKMYQQKIQSLKQKLSQSMAEGWSDAMVARRTGQPRTPYSVYIKGKKWKDFANDDLARAVMNKLKAKFKADGRDPETVTIAPTDMSEEALVEGIRDTASATAVIACLLTGGSLSGCATAPQQTSAQQVLKTGQDLGRTVQTAQRITRTGVEAEVNQEIRNLLRGINRPEEFNNSNIIRIWKRIKGQPPVQPEPQAPEYGPAEPVRRPATEAKEIVSKEDFVRERDRLLRMIGQETNPANKQILKSAIRQLENRAENEGWITIQNRMVREDSDGGEAVEMAIMRRMLVAHTDLIVEFGLDKVVQAIEEVAYDVGDVDEIGSSDVSGWVRQVRQILGADA